MRLPKGQYPIANWEQKATTSDYGWRNLGGKLGFHCGIDKASNGDACFPWRAGKVVAVYANVGEIYVDHPDDKVGNQYVQTVYAHGKDVRVSVGQKVTEKTQLMTTDNKGNTTGPHLHFGLRLKPSNQCQNPELYFRDDWYWDLQKCKKERTTLKIELAKVKANFVACKKTRSEYLTQRNNCRKTREALKESLAITQKELEKLQAKDKICQNKVQELTGTVENQKMAIAELGDKILEFEQKIENQKAQINLLEGKLAKCKKELENCDGDSDGFWEKVHKLLVSLWEWLKKLLGFGSKSQPE